MGEKSEARKVRRDKGIRLLTERDLWVLRWIAEQSCVRFDQLQKLLSRQPLQRNQNTPGSRGLTPSAVAQVLNRWMEEPAYVQYERLYVGRPGWIWLSTHGERLLNLPYEGQAQRNFPRQYLINEMRLYCEEQYPEAIWKSERQLQHSQEAGAAVPVGELWLATDRYAAIEIAQFGQSSNEIVEVLRALLKGYQAIWCFSNAIQRGVVEQAQQSLPAECSARVRLMSLEPLQTLDRK